jgi:RNA polymerase sigma factor (sigma-70 family)
MVVNVRGPAEDPGRVPRRVLDGMAREWALCPDRDGAGARFDGVVRVAEQEMTAQARRLARRLVGDAEADDILSEAWTKVWERSGRREERSGRYDPDRASFDAYFLRIVRNLCLDVLRRRKQARGAEPAVDTALESALAQGAGLYPQALPLEEEVVASLTDLQAQIWAAIAVLDLSEKHRAMLRLMIDPDLEPSPAAAPQDEAAAGHAAGEEAARREKARARKEIERVRARLGQLSCLTPEEIEAVALMRKHHSLAAAATASATDENDLRDAYASAKRKILALFGIESED